MENILHDFYYGFINPHERRPSASPEYKAVNQKIEDEKRYFIQKMPTDDCERFQKLEALYTESCDYEQLSAFSYGFKLGLALTCAAFTDER
ncbi:MAG: hypothetical protein FWE20_02780 [Defluviitaleaceae bacterium]|nr:hypothetical protein [Defluviitaleaceae bacterium]